MPRASRSLSLPQTRVAAAPAGDCHLVVDEQHLQRVVTGGIMAAKISLDVMTADFKAMLVPAPTGRRGRAKSIVEVFRELAGRGVEIRILHAGVPSAPALQQLKRDLPGGLTIRRCPRLHAKAVIVDSAAMYLGSANLTGAGLGAKAKGKRNFEMGVWTTATPLIDAVLGEFNMLWEGRQCAACRRREVCPEPLEEPRL